MAIKGLWAGTCWWLRTRKPSIGAAHQQEINEDDPICRNDNSADQIPEKSLSHETKSNNVVVRAARLADRQESLQKLQEGLDKLVKNLQGINTHLSHRAAQQKDLMTRIEQLPKKFESFSAAVKNQKRITEQLLEQLKASEAKSEQFLDAVEKIPNETVKQTDALVDINNQLSASADIDVQMTESLKNFNENIDKLNHSTVNQTDGIIQMSETFDASDKYLKYIISRQNKHFMWNIYYGKVLWVRSNGDSV